ncbi:MAG: hypothetical protein NT069_08240 [Planctomycetota bacterium]|nr:hypothetical protein [Planctomycetota bacterium]
MKLELKSLSLETIGEMEPKIPALIQNLIQQIATDLWNRPTDKKPRKLTMELSFVPVPDTSNGIVSCDSARVTFKAKPTLPQYATIDFPCDVTKAGIRFNAQCPESLDQTTLPYGDGDN